MILYFATAEVYRERMRVKIRTANGHLGCWPCVTRDHPCWIWHGSRQKPDDRYGRFGFEGRNRHAHIVSYILFKGDFPAGLTIDHLCNVTLCVNPAHLEAVTQAENIRRRYERTGYRRSRL